MTPLGRRLVAIITLGLALLVVAILTLRALGVPIAVGPLASPTPVPLPSATPEPSAAASLSIEDALAAIEADVADLRDLPPADIGTPRIVSRDELADLLAERADDDYPPEEVAADNVLYHALGLLAPDQDIGELTLQLLSGQVLGYYNPETGEMVVVTEEGLTPELETIYAHEYTHALQDGAFDIEAMATDGSDRSFAELGLVEGDATTVMTLWAVENLSIEEILEIGQTPLPDTAGIPAWMIRQLEFPYLVGTEFVTQLFASGSFAAVDEAWADPPLTTEQVIHYGAYVDDEQPTQPPGSSPVSGTGFEVVLDTTFGEAMTAIWLAALGVPQGDADAAAAGWGGDAITALTSADGEMALVLRTAWDSPVDAEEFVAAYEVALERLDLFGHLERVSDTEVVIRQGTSEAFVESFAGPLD
ncbi:MAG TPA: hypothetical protein VIA02_05350 [Candidatus Limnocylindria bacterium]|jgi:hypothetical protein